MFRVRFKRVKVSNKYFLKMKRYYTSGSDDEDSSKNGFSFSDAESNSYSRWKESSGSLSLLTHEWVVDVSVVSLANSAIIILKHLMNINNYTV